MAAARNGENPLIKRLPIKDQSGRVIGHKEVVSYRGLLDLVHRERVQEIRTKLLHAPRPENGETAIVHALVRTSRGVFTGIGDANPRNVTAKLVPHIIRMAETRAEARAMRKAVNIGVVALEELEDLPEDVTLEGTMVPTGMAEAPPTSSFAPDAPSTSQPPSNDGAPAPSQARRGNGDVRASEQQKKYLYRLLAERGITGERARAHIHQKLAVASLAEASKFAVSRLIDELLKGSGNGSHPPEAA